MMDTTTPIIEEEAVTTHADPELEKRTQSLLCALRFHRRTRWSKPFARTETGVVMFTGATHSQVYWFQIRECLGCGMREERTLGHD